MYLFSSSAHVRPRSRPLTPDPPLLSRRAVTADPFSGSRGVGGGAPAASEPAGKIHFGPRAGPQAGVESDLGYPGKAFPAPSSRLSPQTTFACRLEFDSGPGWPSLWSPGLPWRLRGTGLCDLWDPGRRKGLECGPPAPSVFSYDGTAPSRRMDQTKPGVQMSRLLLGPVGSFYALVPGAGALMLGWELPESSPHQGGVGGLPASLLRALEKEERFARWQPQLARWQV